jgi:predicted ATPase
MTGPLKKDVRVSSQRTPEKVRFLTAEELLNTVELPQYRVGQPFLQHVVVEGLLSFGQKTRFNFGQLNLLVGPNGSGKSNLLDCIRILRLAPLDIQEAFKDSGFEEWLYKGTPTQSAHASLETVASLPGLSDNILHQLRLVTQANSRVALEEVISSSGNEEQRETYFIGSYRARATLNVAVTNKRRRNRNLGVNEYNPFASILSQIRDVGQYPEITRLAEFYGQFRIYSEWTFGRNSSLREAAPTNRTNSMLSETMDDLPLALNALEKTAAHEDIRLLLRELKETYVDYITRILFGRVGLELLESPFETSLPAKRLSDGTLRFLALAAIFFQPQPPPLICLEEPELGMHPDMIRMVAKMIVDAAKRTQLIITTHSEHLLSALQDDFDTLFAFDAGLDGSVIRQFSQKEYQQWRQDHTLGELWTSGELGGNRW